MGRSSVMAWYVALIAFAVFTSCSEPNLGGASVRIDLNRTTTADMSLHDVLRPESNDIAFKVNEFGVYVLPTDSIPTSIYVATWDSAHSLPLLIHRGSSFNVCGTWLEWGRLTCSDAETLALWEAEALRSEVCVGRDSALAGVRDVLGVKPRQDVVDSVNAVLSAVRERADALLRRCDTSLVALPIIGIGGLYDAVADKDVVVRIAHELKVRYPDVKPVIRLCAEADSAVAIAQRLETEEGSSSHMMK